MRVGYGSYFLAQEAFLTEADYLSAVEKARHGDVADFTPYTFSMRHGVENWPGHQGYHGLKGQVSDDFLTIGVPKRTATGDDFLPYEEGFGKVFFTHVVCEKAMTAHILCGEIKPDHLYINGELVDVGQPVQLRPGRNTVAAGYTTCGRTHLIVANRTVEQATHPLAMRWYRSPAVLPFTVADDSEQTFTFTAPPGLQELSFRALESIHSIRVNGQEVPFHQLDKCHVYLPEIASCPAEVVIITGSENGHLGGAVFDGPIRACCGKGTIKTGDWSKIGGMKYYSGGVAYTQNVTLTAAQIRNGIQLEIADLSASAEVFVNGASAGIRVAPPWRWDITGCVHAGKNAITVQVFSSLANHYEGTPTRYKGDFKAGLLGRARLDCISAICCPIGNVTLSNRRENFHS